MAGPCSELVAVLTAEQPFPTRCSRCGFGPEDHPFRPEKIIRPGDAVRHPNSGEWEGAVALRVQQDLGGPAEVGVVAVNLDAATITRHVMPLRVEGGEIVTEVVSVAGWWLVFLDGFGVAIGSAAAAELELLPPGGFRCRSRVTLEPLVMPPAPSAHPCPACAGTMRYSAMRHTYRCDECKREWAAEDLAEERPARPPPPPDPWPGGDCDGYNHPIEYGADSARTAEHRVVGTYWDNEIVHPDNHNADRTREVRAARLAAARLVCTRCGVSLAGGVVRSLPVRCGRCS